MSEMRDEMLRTLDRIVEETLTPKVREAVDAERERLFELVRRLVEPTGPDPKTLAEAQARMIRDVPKIDYVQRAGDAIAPLSLPVQ